MTFHQVPVDMWGIIASFVSYGNINPILYLSKTVQQAILESLATEKTCVDFYVNLYTKGYVLNVRDENKRDYIWLNNTHYTLRLPQLGQIVLLLLEAHALKRIENIELLRDICKKAISFGHTNIVTLLYSSEYDVSKGLPSQYYSRDSSWDAVMYNALIRNYVDLVQFFLTAGWDPTLHHFYCDSVLHSSLTFGHIEVARLLFTGGFYSPNDVSSSSLRVIARNDYENVLEFLFEYEDVDVFRMCKQAWRAAVKNGSVKVMKILLRYLDPSAHNNAAIKNTVRAGKVEMARLLLQDERIDPGADENQALYIAIEKNAFELITILLNDARVDPTANNHELLMFAINKNCYTAAICLVKDGRVDPSVDNNAALFGAINYCRDAELVRLLLADLRVDPSARSNQAIVDATTTMMSEIVEVLLTDPRVDPSVQDFRALYNVLKFHKEDLLVGMLQLVDKKHVEYVSTKFFSYVAEFYPSMLKFVEQYCANEL
jgi:ankyrin repeat protein